MTTGHTPTLDDEDLTPDPALVRRVASRVNKHLGPRTGKAKFADIEAAIDTDPRLSAELDGLDDGARELLLDDVQTEIG